MSLDVGAIDMLLQCQYEVIAAHCMNIIIVYSIAYVVKLA